MTLDATLLAARRLVAAVPALSRFAPDPGPMVSAGLPPAAMPALPLLHALPAEGAGPAADLHRIVCDSAHLYDWRRTYSAEEVGEDFRNRYGYVELWGTTGHFRHAASRAFIGFWDRGLVYDWHRHQAEELYYVLAGSARFRTEGAADETLRQGGTRQHTTLQSHALDTPDAPLLAFVLWRGPGLDVMGKMERR